MNIHLDVNIGEFRDLTQSELDELNELIKESTITFKAETKAEIEAGTEPETKTSVELDIEPEVKIEPEIESDPKTDEEA